MHGALSWQNCLVRGIWSLNEYSDHCGSCFDFGGNVPRTWQAERRWQLRFRGKKPFARGERGAGARRSERSPSGRCVGGLTYLEEDETQTEQWASFNPFTLLCVSNGDWCQQGSIWLENPSHMTSRSRQNEKSLTSCF